MCQRASDFSEVALECIFLPLPRTLHASIRSSRDNPCCSATYTWTSHKNTIKSQIKLQDFHLTDCWRVLGFSRQKMSHKARSSLLTKNVCVCVCVCVCVWVGRLPPPGYNFCWNKGPSCAYQNAWLLSSQKSVRVVLLDLVDERESEMVMMWQTKDNVKCASFTKVGLNSKWEIKSPHKSAQINSDNPAECMFIEFTAPLKSVIWPQTYRHCIIFCTLPFSVVTVPKLQ